MYSAAAAASRSDPSDDGELSASFLNSTKTIAETSSPTRSTRISPRAQPGSRRASGNSGSQARSGLPNKRTACVELSSPKKRPITMSE